MVQTLEAYADEYVWFRSLQTLRHMPMNVSSSGASNKANIFLGLIEYELNSLLGASHLVDYISGHIRFDLERYFLNIRHKSAL